MAGSMKEFGRARVALWLAVLAEVALLLQMSGGISEARPEVVVEEEEVDDFVQINSHLSDPKRTRISKHRIKTPLPPHLRPASEYGFGYKGNFTKFVHSDGATHADWRNPDNAEIKARAEKMAAQVKDKSIMKKMLESIDGATTTEKGADMGLPAMRKELAAAMAFAWVADPDLDVVHSVVSTVRSLERFIFQSQSATRARPNSFMDPRSQRV